MCANLVPQRGAVGRGGNFKRCEIFRSVGCALKGDCGILVSSSLSLSLPSNEVKVLSLRVPLSPTIAVLQQYQRPKSNGFARLATETSQTGANINLFLYKCIISVICYSNRTLMIHPVLQASSTRSPDTWVSLLFDGFCCRHVIKMLRMVS